MDSILTIEEARDLLRIDGTANDGIIAPLLAAIPDYIYTTTGADWTLNAPTLCKTVAGFILQLWYNPDGTDAARLELVVNSMLKTIKAQATSDNTIK